MATDTKKQLIKRILENLEKKTKAFIEKNNVQIRSYIAMVGEEKYKETLEFLNKRNIVHVLKFKDSERYIIFDEPSTKNVEQEIEKMISELCSQFGLVKKSKDILEKYENSETECITFLYEVNTTGCIAVLSPLDFEEEYSK